MSMFDSFLNKNFKAAKCKTLLKLSVPRIKLLRNRREAQIKQMRRDIAKLLETGQEATARIRVEHIIREEKTTAAQEILELFCELIAVRLPIIEAQRECPLDLKEAISSICFAAPRCSDLPELQQVQILFVSKYGKEFVSAAAELRPDCGVNRQLIELLSVRAPPPEAKLKLLKEIAEDHDLDWDPAATETEFSKPHEDLLDVTVSKLPLPKPKHKEHLSSALNSDSDSDAAFDPSDFPQVPQVPLHSNTSMPVFITPKPVSPFPEHDRDALNEYKASGHVLPESSEVDKPFVPFVASATVASATVASRSYNVKRCKSPPAISTAKSNGNLDLQDVLAVARAAIETADHAAAAARSAATLAHVRIAEFTKRNNDLASEIARENSSHLDFQDQATSTNMQHSNYQNSSREFENVRVDETRQISEVQNTASFVQVEASLNSPASTAFREQEPGRIQIQMLPLDDNSYFSFPNLLTSQNQNVASSVHSFPNNFKSTYDL